MIQTVVLLLTGVIGLSASLLGGVVLVRLHQRRRGDRERRVYLASFPRDLPHDAVLNFVRALSGLPAPRLMQPTHTVVFDTYADASGIQHYLSIPRNVTAGVEALFRTHIAGGSLVRVAVDPVTTTPWDEAVELKTSSARLPLRIARPEATTATLLSKFAPLADDEAVLMQWVLLRAHAELGSITNLSNASKADADRTRLKEKLSEPLFLAVGRVGAKGHKARDHIASVRDGLASTHAQGMVFRKRAVSSGAARERIHGRVAPLVFPCHLNAREVSAVLGFPFGTPNVPGLPVSRSRQLAATRTIPSRGFVVGKSNFPGDERVLALVPAEQVKHTHIQGKTGTGKSTLITSLVVQQADLGYGVGVIDPTGDLIEDILPRLPRERIDDVVLFDPADTEHPIGFNIFSGTKDPEVVADQLMAIFHGIYKDNGLWANNYLRAAIQTLAAVPGMTLCEVPAFLSDERFRAKVVERLADPMLTDLWHQFDTRGRERHQLVAPAIHRVQPLLMRRSVRLTLGQSHNQIDMPWVIGEGKILLVNVSKGQIGEETSSLFGSLVFARVWQAAQGRARGNRKPFFLHIDEAQNFVNMPLAIADVLAEARKYGLGLTLAHQHESQLPAAMKAAVHANTRTKIMFQLSAEDAKTAAKELGPPIEPEDLVSLGRYEVVMQTSTDERTSPPATARTLPPIAPRVSAEAVRAASRRQWSKRTSDVEQELSGRLRDSRTKPRPPSAGWEEA